MPNQHKIYNSKYSYCIFRFTAASQLNETKNDALSIIGKVGEKEKNINISLSLKSESYPLVISILGMSTSNPSITISVRAETKDDITPRGYSGPSCLYWMFLIIQQF